MGRHVYFEKQGPDRMCALHCLNGIVQGPAYAEADLQREAKLLDDEERRLLTPRSRQNYTSSNVALDGHFSFSVIENCLRRHQLDCIPWSSERAALFRQNPGSALAYLLHSRDHWLGLRNVHGSWYVLDSLRAAPQKIRDKFIHALTGYIDRGYLVFIVMPVQGCAFPVVKVRFDRLRENQSLLDDAESEKLLRDEEERLIKEHEALKRETESPTSFMTPKSTTLDPALLFKGEAHSVGGTTVMRYDDVDVDTRMAIGHSVQQLKARLQKPPPEPVTGITIMVRLPDGKKLQRVFALEHTLLHLCQWIELDSEVVPPLCSQAYKLKRPYSSFLVCRMEGKVALDGEEVSTASISSLLNLEAGDREQLIVSFLA